MSKLTNYTLKMGAFVYINHVSMKLKKILNHSRDDKDEISLYI